MRELLKAAINFKGTALLDIISPCVTFNNHEESTKSYTWGKAHEERLHDITFVPAYDEIQVDYEPGTVRTVKLHDGPTIQLRKLDEDYDPTDQLGAIKLMMEARDKQEFITGLIYINESRKTLIAVQDLPETPLAHLPEGELRPPREALEKLMASML